MEILLVGPEKAGVQAARIDARDLGHLRAVVRKDAHAGRAGTGVRQIDYLDVGERTFGSSLGAHGLTSSQFFGRPGSTSCDQARTLRDRDRPTAQRRA